MYIAIDFNGLFGIHVANKMGINMGNIFGGINMGNFFLRINIGNLFEFLVSKRVRVACRGGLWRKILVKNDLLIIGSAFVC